MWKRRGEKIDRKDDQTEEIRGSRNEEGNSYTD